MKKGQILVLASIMTLALIGGIIAYALNYSKTQKREAETQRYKQQQELVLKRQSDARIQEQENEKKRIEQEIALRNKQNEIAAEKNRILREQAEADQRRWEHSVKHGPRMIQAVPSEESIKNAFPGKMPPITQKDYNETRRVHKLSPREEWYMACKALDPNDPCQ